MTSLPELIADLSPVFVAPMAGGPSTPALVAAAWRAGFVAQLAAGYRTAVELERQLDETDAADVGVFGVNLFVPSGERVDPAAYAAYRARLLPEAAARHVELPADPIEDDDAWAEKRDVLLRRPVPIVSFTFGLPPRADIAAMRRAGSLTVQTVTSRAEAEAAAAAGVDVLMLQGYGAGGHSGVWDPTSGPEPVDLDRVLGEVRRAVDLPVIATGGIGTAARVGELLAAGAAAVAVGTAVLASPESGASDLHKTALTDASYHGTVITRAFTGRPARALRNRFVAEHDAAAPHGYPALHHLTRPLRQAATAAGDPSALNLWAGTAHASAAAAPVAETLTRLLP